MKSCFLEVAVDSLEALIAAELAGADRIELCANLNEGGVSASQELLSKAVATRKAADPCHGQAKKRRLRLHE